LLDLLDSTDDDLDFLNSPLWLCGDRQSYQLSAFNPHDLSPLATNQPVLPVDLQALPPLPPLPPQGQPASQSLKPIMAICSSICKKE